MLEIKKIVRGGQVTLPKAFREKYDLVEGDLIELIEQDGCLILKPIKSLGKKNAAQQLLDYLNQAGDKIANVSEDKLLKLIRTEQKKSRKK